MYVACVSHIAAGDYGHDWEELRQIFSMQIKCIYVCNEGTDVVLFTYVLEQ